MNQDIKEKFSDSLKYINKIIEENKEIFNPSSIRRHGGPHTFEQKAAFTLLDQMELMEEGMKESDISIIISSLFMMMVSTLYLLKELTDMFCQNEECKEIESMPDYGILGYVENLPIIREKAVEYYEKMYKLKTHNKCECCEEKTNISNLH